MTPEVRINVFASSGFAALCLSLCQSGAAELKSAEDSSLAPAGWSTAAPRDEIKPEFAFEPQGGADGRGCFIIRSDAREGLDGSWTRTFPVSGGKHYRFFALYKSKSVTLPRRSIVAKLDWQDADGKSVLLDEPTVASYLRGEVGTAETEFPASRATND